MKSAILLMVGVTAGFLAAHAVARTPQGRAFFDEVDQKAQEFGAAVADGYRARQAEFSQVVDDVADDIRRRT